MSNIFKFFIKRVGIFYLILVITCFFNKSQRISMLFFLTFSVLFSSLRFWLLESIINNVGKSGNKRLKIIISLILYILGLLIIGVLLVYALNFGIYTFVVTLVGSFSIVIITIINAITEALGITKNRFGEKVI